MGHKLRFSQCKNAERTLQSTGANKRGRPPKRKGLTFTKELPPLPKEWVSNVDDKGILTLSKISHCPPVMTPSVVIDEVRRWILYTHGKVVNPVTCEAIQSLVNLITNIKIIESLINQVNILNVCPGHLENDFVDMLKQKYSRGEPGWVQDCKGENLELHCKRWPKLSYQTGSKG